MAKCFPNAEQGSHKGTGELPAKLAAPSCCLGLPEQAEQCWLQEKMQFPQISTVLFLFLRSSWAV